MDNFCVKIYDITYHNEEIPGTADNGKYVSPQKSSAVMISLSNTENWIIAFRSWHCFVFAALDVKSYKFEILA